MTNPHDAIEDDGTRVVCRCGKTWEGPKARDQHSAHFKVEELRQVLRDAEERKGSVGS